MSAITLTLTNTCSGGNHLTFGVTGDKTVTFPASISELSDPITNDDAVAFAKIIAKMARAGRTIAQAKTLLQNGVTVNV